jgi:outer membrane protein OmpA-like peptidoglycan-associated protein
VTFAHQSSQLSAAAAGLLDRLAPMLRQASVRLEGHADRSERDAALLSLERARAVQRYLVGKGVPAERLQVRALAATQPVSSGSGQEGAAGNRRVEIDVAEE